MRLIVCVSLVSMLLVGVGGPPSASAQQDGLTLEQAVKRVKARGDVKVLSAERVTRDGQPMYRIKVLTGNGRVRYVWVNAGG